MPVIRRPQDMAGSPTFGLNSTEEPTQSPMLDVLVQEYLDEAARLEQQAAAPMVRPQGAKEHAVSGVSAFLEGMGAPGGYFGQQKLREEAHAGQQASTLSRAKDLRDRARFQQTANEGSRQFNASLAETQRLRQIQEATEQRLGRPDFVTVPPGHQGAFVDPTNQSMTPVGTPTPSPQTDKVPPHRDRVEGENVWRDYFEPSNPEVVTFSADLGPMRSIAAGESFHTGTSTVQYTTPDGQLAVGVLDRKTNTITPARLAGQEPTDPSVVAPLATAEQRNRVAAQGRVGIIIDSIGELADKINLGQGLVAKAQGEIAKGQAQLNYNDDVAEYQALISGFTPMVARAVGHSGVLTQQDVDSVRAMFPTPGDSKTLKDRKLARLKFLLGSMAEQGLIQNAPTSQGVAAPSPSASPTQTPGAPAATPSGRFRIAR